jgi:hypothetical protein
LIGQRLIRIDGGLGRLGEKAFHDCMVAEVLLRMTARFRMKEQRYVIQIGAATPETSESVL